MFRLGAMYDMIAFSFNASQGNTTARAMAGVDFRHVAALIERGARGTLVSVRDILTIWTE